MTVKKNNITIKYANYEIMSGLRYGLTEKYDNLCYGCYIDIHFMDITLDKLWTLPLTFYVNWLFYHELNYQI